MNIVTYGYLLARAIACERDCARGVHGMPSESGGWVWWPYSVIQIGVDLRLNQVFRLVSKRGRDISDTFGQRTTCVGFEFGLDGYGWCAQAANLRFGLAFATS